MADASKPPRSGIAPAIIGLGIVAFIVAMVLIFLALMRTPQPEMHPEKQRSSSLYPVDAGQLT